MKNIIKNNKGYMLVEIIVASVIALVMAYFLIDVTIKLVNKNNDYYIDSVLLTDKNLITKEIMDDINSKKLVSVIVNDEHTEATLTYDDDDDTTKKIIIDKENKTIKYGNYTKKLSDKINIEEINVEIKTINEEKQEGILVINIPIYTNYSKEDYGIKLSLIYSEDMEIVYPKMPDLIIDNVPVPTGSYNVDTSNCEQVSMTYDYAKKGFKVSNVSLSANAKCSPIVTETTKTTFATYIKNLLGTSTSVISTRDPNNPDGSTLEKITDNGEEDYRYRGINPNNYVMFNNELWRIIGVFDDNTHSITDTHLVKIIRNDSIGSYVWDNAGSSGSNNFPNSDIYNILTAYYNHSYATGQDYCYANRTLKGKCDFTKIGIQTEYQDMVETGVNWFLGGARSADYTSSEMYANERSNTKYSSNYATTSASGKTVPVGLMYISDYGYASPSSCTANLIGYYTNKCTESNWIKSNNEWTLMHNSSNSYVFRVLQEGVDDFVAAKSNGTRPTLYLKSDVYYISGTGTQVDPYIIAID